MGNCLSTCTKSSEPTLESHCVLQGPDGTVCQPTQVLEGEKVRELVQHELQALQNQISHSQAVLAKLHFRFTDEVPASPPTELATVHRTTQTSNPDTLPRSLECVTVTGEKDWQNITSSCPAIVNTAVQTDDETTSKSNNTSGEYFLPPISPFDSQASGTASPKDLDEFSTKPFEPRPLSHIDLDIYRSCRKLSVLPEEEGIPEEVSPPTAGSRLAPSYCPHQAHSFESYLLPTPNSNVRRQLSDPTPSPDIHPASRWSSRSTCRPLQLQPEVFRFPDVDLQHSEKEVLGPKSPPCVTFQNPLEELKDDFLPRITSPTYNILQDTVSQLITMSSESLDNQNDYVQSSKKESLSIPGYPFTPDGSSPFKTPPDSSIVSSPGFFTPQDFSEKKLLDSSSSSSFQTPASASPGANGSLPNGNKSTSNSSQSFKTPPVDVLSEKSSHQSSFNTPLFMSPLKKRNLTNTNNEDPFTEVPDLKKLTNDKLYVKPLPGDFDRNRSMLSILLDEPRVQNDNTVDERSTPFISFTSLTLQQQPPDQVPSSADASSLSPGVEGGLARTPSRRRLQRSLVRISSETPLELIPVQGSVTGPTADVPPTTPPDVRQETQGRAVDTDVVAISTANMTSAPQDGSVMRRTNSDHGAGPLATGGAGLPASNSFPSLSDTVLRQLGALMEEVKQKDSVLPKEGDGSYEKEIESKFTSLMLAFKTDKLTLERRLELQMRLRDQAEANMVAELDQLKAAVQLLSPLCTDSEKIELLEKVSEQVDALHKSTIRVSTSAEMYGAVQQENRLSRAVDIVLRHVENLKQAYDKEKTEHEETRKILTDNKMSPSAVVKLESRSVTRARLGSLPRKLSNTILEGDSEETPPSKDQASNSGGLNHSQVQKPMENAAGTASTPTRSQPRKPHIPEDRRVSHTGDPESEDETFSQDQARSPTDSPILDSKYSNQSRRISIQSSWLSKLSAGWEWVGPLDELLVHLRWGVAILLLVAALAVLTHCCLLPYTNLGS